MFNTYVNTLLVVPSGSNVSPTTVVKGDRGVPMRCEVKNVGGVLLFFGVSSGDVGGNDGPTTAVFRVPPGDTDIFVLIQGQTLYAVGAGAGGLVSVAVSEAIPLSR